MNKKQIKHITNKHYRGLKKLIRKIAENFDVEDIHQFRVEYKKLRAFFRMIARGQESGRELKMSKKIKKAYHISGAIRDLQLQQQLILEATKQEPKRSQAYIHFLQEEIDRLKPELFEIILEKPIAECKKKTDTSLPDKFTLRSYRNFIKQKWTTVYTIIVSRRFSDDNIHTIRKNLKDLFYNLKIYEGVEQDILSQRIWKAKDEAYFYQLLDELGSFQDKCTAITLIRSYRHKDLNAYNRELPEQIKKGWVKDKLSLKRLLVNKLKA